MFFVYIFKISLTRHLLLIVLCELLRRRYRRFIYDGETWTKIAVDQRLLP